MTQAFINFSRELRHSKEQAQLDSDRKHEQITTTQQQLTHMQQQTKQEFEKTHEEIRAIQEQVHQARVYIALEEFRDVMQEVKTTVKENQDNINVVRREQKKKKER